MTAGPSNGTRESAALHVPVLLADVLHHLGPLEGRTIIDGTFGAGGYTSAILAGGAAVIAIDRDPTALSAGEPLLMRADGRLTLVEGRFSALDTTARDHGHAAVDAVVLDIGVSSMQLDRAERGFSFRFDGPLDMRMGDTGETAADLIARLDEHDLADLIFTLGEERFSRPVARAIVKARSEAPILTTTRLAEIVARVVRSKPGDIHPATRTFQALRIAVNDELGELEAALAAAERILKPGGRLVVVTFHSLEDRIVKHFLVERSGRAPAGSRHLPTPDPVAPTFTLLSGKPVEAGSAECAANPRARSAKLRSAIRTDAPIMARRP